MKIKFTFAAIFAGISKAAVSLELNKNNGLGSSTETRMAAAILDTVDDKKCWMQLGNNVIDTQNTYFAMARDALILAVKENNVVKVYRLVENMWRAFGGDIDPQFGPYTPLRYRLSLSADGDVLAIAEGTYDSQRGRVTIFELNDEEWKQRGDPILGENERDGQLQSVSLSSDSNAVAIGSPYSDTKDHTKVGKVQIFEYAAEEWKRRGNIITGEATNDEYGYSLKLSADGLIVAIGAPYNDDNGAQSGHVRAFELNADKNTWQQLGDDVDGEASGDRSGSSLSMSDDGTVLAIGAKFNEGNGVYAAGHTRVYKYNETATKWMQRGQDIDGESASDQSGHSVDLSSDGSYVLVGARTNDSIGSVLVYGYNPTDNIWVQRGQDLYKRNPLGSYTTAISGDATVVAINGENTDNINVMKWMTCPTPVPTSTPSVSPTIAPKRSSMPSSVATINPTIAPIVLSLYLGYCFIFVF